MLRPWSTWQTSPGWKSGGGTDRSVSTMPSTATCILEPSAVLPFYNAVRGAGGGRERSAVRKSAHGGRQAPARRFSQCFGRGCARVRFVVAAEALLDLGGRPLGHHRTAVGAAGAVVGGVERAPVGGRAAQALVVHALVGGVLIDENQAARAFADEVGAVELAEVAKAGEEGGGGDQIRLGPRPISLQRLRDAPCAIGVRLDHVG